MRTSAGQEKLNKKDVNIGIWGFIGSFAALTAVTFAAVFMFFRSSAYQQDAIESEITRYKTLQNKNELLQERMEAIYARMLMLGSDKVQNEVFLRDNIIEDIRDCRNIMGADSIREFRQYASLIKNMSEMVNLKNELVVVSAEEQVAMRNLRECQGRLDTAAENLVKSVPKNKTRPAARRR